jgi:hypothetical protein
MGSGLSVDYLQRLQALVVDHADDSRRSNGHVQASQGRIVHDDVGLARQCDAAEQRSAIAIQRYQCPVIGRTEKTLFEMAKPCGPTAGTLKARAILRSFALSTTI